MLDKKLTDNEIVKAKELIKKLGEAYDNYYDSSKGMPYDIDTTLLHSAICFKNCLNELNRLQAKLDEAEDTIQFADKELKKANAEIERLKGISDNKTKELLRYNASIEELHKKLETAKAEAYKEFAERLKKESYERIDLTAYVEVSDIDNLLKELEGE